MVIAQQAMSACSCAWWWYKYLASDSDTCAINSTPQRQRPFIGMICFGLSSYESIRYYRAGAPLGQTLSFAQMPQNAKQRETAVRPSMLCDSPSLVGRLEVDLSWVHGWQSPSEVRRARGGIGTLSCALPCCEPLTNIVNMGRRPQT
jgi:hypothetical protein